MHRECGLHRHVAFWLVDTEGNSTVSMSRNGANGREMAGTSGVEERRRHVVQVPFHDEYSLGS